MAGFAIATTLAAALERLDEPGVRPMAGGVGIMLARMRGVDVGDDFVGVGHLPELQLAASRDDGSLEIGAGLTLEWLAESVDPARVPPLLQAAASSAANPGIRAVATIGGNIVDTGAASDLVAALIALGAAVRIARRDDRREVALLDLWGPDDSEDPGLPGGLPALRPGDLIRSLSIPAPWPVGWGWERLTLHGAMDRSTASVAVAIFAGGRTRVALSAAVSRPIRLGAVERVADTAAGGADDAGLGTRVRGAARDDLADAPIVADDRAPVAYRRQVVPVLAERAVAAALARARGTTDA